MLYRPARQPSEEIVCTAWHRRGRSPVIPAGKPRTASTIVTSDRRFRRGEHRAGEIHRQRLKDAPRTHRWIVNRRGPGSAREEHELAASRLLLGKLSRAAARPDGRPQIGVHIRDPRTRAFRHQQASRPARPALSTNPEYKLTSHIARDPSWSLIQPADTPLSINITARRVTGAAGRRGIDMVSHLDGGRIRAESLLDPGATAAPLARTFLTSRPEQR